MIGPVNHANSFRFDLLDTKGEDTRFQNPQLEHNTREDVSNYSVFVKKCYNLQNLT